MNLAAKSLRPTAGAAARIDATADDDVLLAAVATGNRAALGILYARHADALRAAAKSELGRAFADAVDDVVQDVFLVLLAPDTRAFRPARGKALTWLKGIARRTASEHVKQAKDGAP